MTLIIISSLTTYHHGNLSNYFSPIWVIFCAIICFFVTFISTTISYIWTKSWEFSRTSDLKEKCIVVAKNLTQVSYCGLLWAKKHNASILSIGKLVYSCQTRVFQYFYNSKTLFRTSEIGYLTRSQYQKITLNPLKCF